MARKEVARKLKTRLHFNRVNMSRGKSEVWSASNSRACAQVDKIRVMHGGKIVLETEFHPERQQPRAYFSCYGDVSVENGIATVKV